MKLLASFLHIFQSTEKAHNAYEHILDTLARMFSWIKSEYNNSMHNSQFAGF